MFNTYPLFVYYNMEYRVIKYGADWCHQCKQLDKEFEKNPLKCPLHKVDVDELSEEETADLKLKSIPVTILWLYDDDSATWEELHRWIGFVKSEEVNKLINC